MDKICWVKRGTIPAQEAPLCKMLIQQELDEVISTDLPQKQSAIRGKTVSHFPNSHTWT